MGFFAADWILTIPIKKLKIKLVREYFRWTLRLVFIQFSQVLYCCITSDFSTLTNIFSNFPTVTGPIKQTVHCTPERVCSPAPTSWLHNRDGGKQRAKGIFSGAQNMIFQFSKERLTCKSFRNLCFKRILYFTVHVARNREHGRLSQTSHSSRVLHVWNV